MAEQLKPHTARAADDFAKIRQRMTALRLERDGKCAIREGGSSTDCWCYQAGPDGTTLPCPPPADNGQDPYGLRPPPSASPVRSAARPLLRV